VPARADRLKMIRVATQQAAAFVGADAGWTSDLVMAVDEACQNIIRHAYKGRPDAGDIVIDFVACPEALEVQLMDFAPSVDPETIKPRDLSEVRPGGLGVHLIRSVCDDARFLPPPPGVGNLFKLTKRFGSQIKGR
jgi:anti-sigma regulatory factor (Ser/Thr protein kinase)